MRFIPALVGEGDRRDGRHGRGADEDREREGRAKRERRALGCKGQEEKGQKGRERKRRFGDKRAKWQEEEGPARDVPGPGGTGRGGRSRGSYSLPLCFATRARMEYEVFFLHFSRLFFLWIRRLPRDQVLYKSRANSIFALEPSAQISRWARGDLSWVCFVYELPFSRLRFSRSFFPLQMHLRKCKLRSKYDTSLPNVPATLAAFPHYKYILFG